MTLSRYAWIYLGLLAFLAAIQLALGASIFLLVTLFIIGATGAIPLSVKNMLISDALYFVACLYNATFSLLIKCFALQPVQSNLITAQQSSSYILIGSISILIGYLFSRSFFRAVPYYQKTQWFFNNENIQEIVTKPMFLLGAVFCYLQTAFRPQAINGAFVEGGFGGFGSFYFLLVLSASLQVSLYIKRPKSRTEIVSVTIMTVSIILLSLIGNIKKTLFDFLLVLMVSYFAYNLRIRFQYILGAIIGLFLMFAYLSPAIHILRSNTNISAAERLSATWEVFSDAQFDPFVLSEKEEKIATGYVLSYYGSYIYPYPWNTERFTLILPVDEVVRALPQVGTMGMPYVFRDITEAILPSIIINKEMIAPNDRIAWHFGFRSNGTITRPVIGLIAGAAASYGLIGVMILPGIAMWIIFSIFNAVGGRLIGNPWGIFVFVSTIELIEKEAGTFIIFFCRNFPFILLTTAVLMMLLRKRMVHAQYLYDYRQNISQ